MTYLHLTTKHSREKTESERKRRDFPAVHCCFYVAELAHPKHKAIHGKYTQCTVHFAWKHVFYSPGGDSHVSISVPHIFHLSARCQPFCVHFSEYLNRRWRRIGTQAFLPLTCRRSTFSDGKYLSLLMPHGVCSSLCVKCRVFRNSEN